MCSVCCKNHGCRQKTPESTSAAMFDVRTIAKCYVFKRCISTRFDVTRVTQVTVFITINTGVFGKRCSDRRKNHGCGQTKPEGTSSAIFEIGTAAKYCELKHCADPVLSTETVLPGILRFQYENIRRRQQQPSQAFTPASLRSRLEFNFAGTSAVKACDGCCCRRRMFSYVGTAYIPGSNGGI